MKQFSGAVRLTWKKQSVYIFTTPKISWIWLNKREPQNWPISLQVWKQWLPKPTGKQHNGRHNNQSLSPPMEWGVSCINPEGEDLSRWLWEWRMLIGLSHSHLWSYMLCMEEGEEGSNWVCSLGWCYVRECDDDWPVMTSD